MVWWRMNKILCLNNQKVYQNIWVASKELDCNPEYIYRVCKGDYKSTKNLIFVYLQEYELMSEEEKQKLMQYKVKKTIICQELNQTFNSINEAVKYCHSLGIVVYKSHICECLQGKRQHCGRYNGEKLTWKRGK